MKFCKSIFFGLIICFSAAYAFGQKSVGTKPGSAVATAATPVKATPAYAELLLRKAELEAEAESLLETYTEEYPKLREFRYELDLTNQDLAKLLGQNDISRLTLALGKLMVRKNQLETDFWALQNKYGKDHPEVKRAQKKVSSFRNSIKEILP